MEWGIAAPLAAVQAFSASEHGMIMAHTQTEGGRQPLLADQHLGAVEVTLAKTQRRAVQACVSEWIQLQVSELPQEELKTLQEVIMKNFKEFILRPSPAEAALYGPTEFTSRQEGGFPMSTGQL